MNIKATEMRLAADWARRLEDPSRAPFSFSVNGESFGEYRKNMRFGLETRIDGSRRHISAVWTGRMDDICVRCEGVAYLDYPAVEWTLWIKNTGIVDSPLIEDILALDAELPGSYTLHRNYGDTCGADSFAPIEEKILPGSPFVIAPPRGRPCDAEAFPYFGLEPAAPAPAAAGVQLAVGWAAQWEAAFVKLPGEERGTRVTAGQQLTHFVLHPGEEVRSPLIAMLFWEAPGYGRAVNMWRRWMMAHNTPFESLGTGVEYIHAFCATPFSPGLKSSAATEKIFIDELIRQDSKPDYWWMDAGWYPTGDDWNRPGTWFPDEERWPGGIRPFSDYLHERGVRTILWCEPERALPGSWLAENHPEWLRGILLDLGNKDAFDWVLGHFNSLITREGIDLYRQDFGMHPLRWYRLDESVDRQGIAENFHVQGYYALWDELRRRHPGMLIDSCASGGRRNDIETLRRAIPLLRSDYQSFEGDVALSAGNQGHTVGLATWIPYHGHGVYYNNEHFVYSVRSYLSPAICIPVDVRRGDIDWDVYRKVNREWRELAPLMCSDFYLLLPYSVDEDKWLAWQYDRPEEGDGFFMAFRRRDCTEKCVRLRLAGLDPSAIYVFTDADTGETFEADGHRAEAEGISTEILVTPGSRLLKYCKKI